jgi:TRAP-type C4-dicarboxylate transport system permease small subunit
MKILKKMEKVFSILIVITYVMIIVIVSIQVICRATPLKAPSWTEEASRYAMVYLVVFTVGFAIKNDAFIGVDTLFQVISERKKLVIKFIDDAIMIIFAVVFFIFGIKFFQLGEPQICTTMPIFRLSFFYFSMILYPILMIIYLTLNEVELIREFITLSSTKNNNSCKEVE